MMICDRLLFVAMIVIPLMITFVSGYAIRYEMLDIITAAAVDEDGSDYSALLLERISCKEGLSLNLTVRENGFKMLENNEVEQVFIIKRGFGEAVRKGDNEGLIELTSSPLSYSSGFIQEVIAGEVMRLVTSNSAANSVVELYEEYGIDKDAGFRSEVIQYADGLWEPSPLMTIDYRGLKAGSGIVAEASMPRPTAYSAQSAGMIIAFIMFYMLYGSGWLIEERMNGTIKRLGVGNGAILASFTGSVIAFIIAGLLQLLLFTLVQRIFFGIILFTGVLSYLVLFAYLLAVISISLFLSSVLRTPSQMQAAAPIMALVTSFAGGCFWNFLEMPDKIARLSLLTPQGWALKAANNLLISPSDVVAVLPSITILLASGLILLPVSYMIINMQIKNG